MSFVFNRNKKLVELENLLQRPRNQRKIVFGNYKAGIELGSKATDRLIISGSSAGIAISGSTSFDGSTAIFGALGSDGVSTYAPAIATPITAFDTVTDCSVAGTGTGNAIAAIVDGVGGGEMIKLGTFHSSASVKGHIIMLNNSIWYAADRSDSSGANAADALLAVALDIDGGVDEGLVLLRGIVRIDGTLMNGFTDAATDIGRPVYLSTTAGEYDMAVSSTNNDIVRIIGHMLDTDGTDHLIYFNPSNDWVKVVA